MANSSRDAGTRRCALTRRDLQFFALLRIFLWLTADQAAWLVFGSLRIARRRLRLLVGSGALRSVETEEAPHFGHRRLAFFAPGDSARPGDAEVKSRARNRSRREGPGSRGRGKPPSLHQLGIIEVLVSFLAHADQSRGRLRVELVPEWSRLHDDGARFRHALEMVSPHPRRHSTSVTLIPDAAICLELLGAGKSLLFLEFDRGTEPLEFVEGRETLKMKIESYEQISRCGGFQGFSEPFRGEFSGFRVLFVCMDESRCRSVARLAAEAGSQRVFTASIADISAVGPLSQVWMPPGDVASPRVWLTSLHPPPLRSGYKK